MRQLFIEKQSIVIKNVSQPLLDADLILVKTAYSYISSGTESSTLSKASESIFFSNIANKMNKIWQALSEHGIEGTKALIKGKLHGTAMPLGYSCSGRVIAVGQNIASIKVGDLVACAGAGYASHAELVCVPENLVVKISHEQFLKDASITTIGAIALQGLRRAQLQLGELVCVQGLGLLGQLTVQLAKNAGCTVIGIDIVPERLTLAQQLGADVVFDAQSPTLLNDIAFYTDHNGVDCTLITAASKSNALVQQAMEITRKKGKVVVVGDVGLSLERAPLYQKEIDFLISCSYGPGRYDDEYEKKGYDYPYAYVRWTENRNMQAFVHLIEQGNIAIAPLISECLPLQEAQKAYEHLQAKQCLGVILEYPTNYQQPVQPVAYIPARKAILRVGIIGAGGFAKTKLMPLVARIRDTKITAIVDADITCAINAANVYTPAQALTHDAELFNNDLADVVIIASPHKYHCEQISAALASNTAVFAEKPMVTTFEQLEELQAIIIKSSTPLCIDYNRSCAPFMQTIKKELKKRSTPIVVHYRMNAGFIPKQHWIQTDVGAGRIIGEACHIMDLFCFLTDAQPQSISVETIGNTASNLCKTDNVSIQISFADGSLCTLLYTALGSSQLSKERMELFFDGKAIVMDDYKTLTGYGLPKSFNQKTMSPDKGHQALLDQFFAAVRHGSPLPMSKEHLYTVAYMTLVADQLARSGGGQQVI